MVEKNDLVKEDFTFASLADTLNRENVNWSESFGHFSVLKTEAINALNIKENGIYVDGTLGAGGHSRQILENLSANGQLIVFDKDPEPIAWATEGWAKNEKRIKFIQDDFINFEENLNKLNIKKVDGFLLDLGLNSRQLLAQGRGFSWLKEDPLDMRINPETGLTAWEVVNKYSEKDLADVLWRYGEVRASRRVARGLVWAREKNSIETSDELGRIIAKSLYRPGKRPKIHPATQSFMAIRIEVNQELKTLENFIEFVPSVLNNKARVAIISFHSLEDRLVKHGFRAKKDIWHVSEKKPILPSEEEILKNARARSSKLRFAEYKGE